MGNEPLGGHGQDKLQDLWACVHPLLLPQELMRFKAHFDAYQVRGSCFRYQQANLYRLCSREGYFENQSKALDDIWYPATLGPAVEATKSAQSDHSSSACCLMTHSDSHGSRDILNY